MYKGSNLGDKK